MPGNDMRTWEQMRTSIAEGLVRQTGHGVAWWNARIAAQPDLDDEASLRRWLGEADVPGYQQMLLVMERFGYPDYLLASADEPTDGQYRDRPSCAPSSRRCCWSSRASATSTSRPARPTPHCAPRGAPSRPYGRRPRAASTWSRGSMGYRRAAGCSTAATAPAEASTCGSPSPRSTISTTRPSSSCAEPTRRAIRPTLRDGRRTAQRRCASAVAAGAAIVGSSHERQEVRDDRRGDLVRHRLTVVLCRRGALASGTGTTRRGGGVVALELQRIRARSERAA